MTPGAEHALPVSHYTAEINGRELMFVSHFMRQQTYDPTGPDKDAVEEYALRLGTLGALRCGFGYFRSH